MMMATRIKRSSLVAILTQAWTLRRHCLIDIDRQPKESQVRLCRGCKDPIPASRLTKHPHALLCMRCITERLELMSGDAL
jgi:RNA polymerase-binding transcription factor DksA